MRATLLLGVIILLFWIPLIYLLILVIKALRKYLHSSDVRKEKKTIQK